jgi:Rrf2 family transcriptional regulator, iron-sulfur cluster assembly transcription factor
MQFTKAEEYGIFGVLYLADQPPDRITPLSEISETQGVPEKFLAKIFQALSRSGLVHSHRGVKGGFSLGRPADQISIREIVEEIQGPYFISKCLHTKDICNRKDCPINLLLHKAQEALIDVFDKHTVADLLTWQKSAAANRR